MSEILAYIYDFLSIVFENEEIIDEIKEIILKKVILIYFLI